MAVEIHEPEMDSLVYLIFMKERTQKEAVELIYDKPYSEINIRRFKNSRESLLNEGYITSDGSMRNAKFKSKIDPLLEEIHNRAEQEGEELTNQEVEGLKMLFRSEWFSDLFNDEVFESLPEVGRREGIIEVGAFGGAIEILSEIIDNITYIGRLFDSGKDYNDISHYKSFEEALEECEWETDKSAREVYNKAEKELSRHVREDNLDWKLYLWEKITIIDKYMFCMPKLAFGLTYFPSEMNAIQQEVFGIKK